LNVQVPALVCLALGLIEPWRGLLAGPIFLPHFSR